MPEALQERYERICRTPSDIQGHLPRLCELAGQCRRVVELGTRTGNSTTAILAGQPEEFDACDLHHCPVVDELAPLARRTNFRFFLADSRTVDFGRPCDMLFIDTWHTYAQLKAELERHAFSVRRWIALHDTVTFGERGEDGGVGLLPAVRELVTAGNWQIVEERQNDNGFMLLERVGD